MGQGTDCAPLPRSPKESLRARMLSILARWLRLPFWILYLMKWEHRFRKELAQKSHERFGS
jgi:hypothetical protein